MVKVIIDKDNGGEAQRNRCASNKIEQLHYG